MLVPAFCNSCDKQQKTSQASPLSGSFVTYELLNFIYDILSGIHRNNKIGGLKLRDSNVRIILMHFRKNDFMQRTILTPIDPDNEQFVFMSVKKKG